MSKQSDINEQTTRILESVTRTLDGLVFLGAAHEIRILELEGKPVPRDVRQAHTRSLLRAVANWGDPDDVV